MIASPKLRGSAAAVLTLLIVGSPAALRAQETREELIRGGVQAYDQFEIARALEQLQAGVDPNAGPPDSLWAVGVQLLSQIMMEEGEEELATVWLRWALRLYPEMAVDSVTYLPEVVRAFRAAQDYVAASGGRDTLAETRWRWAPRGVTRGSGALVVDRPDLPISVRLTVTGVGPVTAGPPVELVPGSYEIRAEADGYDPIGITREILPGVTTQLAVNFPPPLVVLGDSALAPAVAATAVSAMARLTAHRFALDPTCGAGFIAGRDGLLVTSYRTIRGADRLAVEFPTGRAVEGDITVAAYDLAANIAVLKLPVEPDDSLPLATDPSDGQYAWGLGYRECESAVATQTRIAAWLNRPSGILSLASPLVGADQGGPVIDENGRVLGLAAADRSAVPAVQVESALREARRNLEARQLLTVGDVATRERHRYGSVAITSDMAGTVARVTPLERWHWAEAAAEDSLPTTFAGPMGRYRLELIAESRVHEQLELQIDPGQRDELFIPLLQVIADDSGGGFPWAIAAVGVAGAAAAAVLVGGGSGGDDGGNGDTTGSISIRIPNP
jgi:hypothetical protein